MIKLEKERRKKRKEKLGADFNLADLFWLRFASLNS